MSDKVRIITGTRTSQEQEHQMKNAFTASCEWNLYCTCTLSRVDLLWKPKAHEERSFTTGIFQVSKRQLTISIWIQKASSKSIWTYLSKKSNIMILMDENYSRWIWISHTDLYKVINEYPYNTRKHVNNPRQIGNTSKCT